MRGIPTIVPEGTETINTKNMMNLDEGTVNHLHVGTVVELDICAETVIALGIVMKKTECAC